MTGWTVGEWLGAAGAVAAAACVVATLYTRRPTRAAARSEARKVIVGFESVGDSAQNAPGFHDGLKLRVGNQSSESVLGVEVWAKRLNKPEPWWQASDGLGPGESTELRLPDAWPCELDVYYWDHLERCWRRRVNGRGVGDVERVTRMKRPRLDL